MFPGNTLRYERLRIKRLDLEDTWTIEHQAKLRQNSISLDVRTRLDQVATGSNVDLSCVNVGREG